MKHVWLLLCLLAQCASKDRLLSKEFASLLCVKSCKCASVAWCLIATLWTTSEWNWYRRICQCVCFTELYTKIGIDRRRSSAMYTANLFFTEKNKTIIITLQLRDILFASYRTKKICVAIEFWPELWVRYDFLAAFEAICTSSVHHSCRFRAPCGHLRLRVHGRVKR